MQNIQVQSHTLLIYSRTRSLVRVFEIFLSEHYLLEILSWRNFLVYDSTSKTTWSSSWERPQPVLLLLLFLRRLHKGRDVRICHLMCQFLVMSQFHSWLSSKSIRLLSKSLGNAGKPGNQHKTAHILGQRCWKIGQSHSWLHFFPVLIHWQHDPDLAATRLPGFFSTDYSLLFFSVNCAHSGFLLFQHDSKNWSIKNFFTFAHLLSNLVPYNYWVSILFLCDFFSKRFFTKMSKK